jgi:hypothetical protein
MPVKDRAPGVEAKRLDAGCVHNVSIPFDKHAVQERPLICAYAPRFRPRPTAISAATLAILRASFLPPAYRNWPKAGVRLRASHYGSLVLKCNAVRSTATDLSFRYRHEGRIVGKRRLEATPLYEKSPAGAIRP